MKTVYVIQNQMHFDKDKGCYAPRFDLSAAEEHGELKFLLSPTAAPFYTEEIIEEIREGLKDFSKEDSILLIGNPVLIGITAAIAADIVGTVQFLQWSGKEKRYIPIKAKIF